MLCILRHSPGLEGRAPGVINIAGNALSGLVGLHQHLGRHQWVYGIREAHVAGVPEIIIELPQVPGLQSQVHLQYLPSLFQRAYLESYNSKQIDPKPAWTDKE